MKNHYGEGDNSVNTEIVCRFDEFGNWWFMHWEVPYLYGDVDSMNPKMHDQWMMKCKDCWENHILLKFRVKSDSPPLCPTCHPRAEREETEKKPRGRFSEDLAGKQFNFWKVIERLPNDSKTRLARWLCECTRCNTQHSVLGRSLKNSTSRMCKKCSYADRKS